MCSHHSLSKVTVIYNWLNIKQRIEYKIISPTYTALQQREPRYILHKLNLRPSGSTRSSLLVTIQLTSVKLQTGKRSLSYAAPYLWNSLPNRLRQPASCPQSGPISTISKFLPPAAQDTSISSFLSTIIIFFSRCTNRPCASHWWEKELFQQNNINCYFTTLLLLLDVLFISVFLNLIYCYSPTIPSQHGGE